MTRETTKQPGEGPDAPAVRGGLNDRGGRIDIEDRPGKSMVEEADEESFPASDPPSLTPSGYIDAPPPARTRRPGAARPK
jgi:hypothetical protein